MATPHGALTHQDHNPVQTDRAETREADRLGAAYPVQQAIFSGPLHLLLALLENRQLEISEVNLVAITSSYWQALNQVGHFQPQSLCDFVDVATRLMALKARFLRPATAEGPEMDPEDEDDQSLVVQLEQLRQFKSPVEDLIRRDRSGLRTYRRQVPLALPQSKVTTHMEQPSRLRKALQRIAGQLPRVQPVTLIPPPLFPIEDQISRVRTALRLWRSRVRKTPLSFFALFTARSHRGEVIAAFLAVLELVRQHSVVAVQKQLFGDIELRLPDDGRQTDPARTGS